MAISATYHYLGDYQKTSEYLQQALTSARQLKNPLWQGSILGMQAGFYYTQGKPQKTIESAQASLNIARQVKQPIIEALALVNLSAGYGDTGNYEKAVDLAQQSLAIFRAKQELRMQKAVLNLLGFLHYKFGHTDKAIASYQEALAIKANEGQIVVNSETYAGLGRIYRNLKQSNVAITYYKQAVNNLESIRTQNRGLSLDLQRSFLQSQFFSGRTTPVQIYRELAELLLSQGRSAEAQEVLDLLKLQELKDFRRDNVAAGQKIEVVTHPNEAEIIKQNGTLIAWGKRIADCQQKQCPQLNQLLTQRQSLIEEFNQKLQKLEKDVRDRLSQDPASFNTQDLLRVGKRIIDAQENTVLINIFVTEDKTWLLWTSKGGIVKSVEVPVGRQKLGETVLAFRELIQSPSTNVNLLNATGKKLYDWLIKPIEPELKANQIQNLVFSLDRSARYIPIGALFDGKKYLVENYSVSTILSASLTDTSEKLPPETQKTSVLALGLSESISNFSALPNVPEELDAIVRQNQQDKKGVYPGREFLNKSFDFRTLQNNLAGQKILHIATHGKFEQGKPEDSYLVLGTGELLTISKVKTLPELSDVHLVVLSACQTALGGPNQDGIEISGISSYFLETGAKAVIASLWLVDDRSTSQLMQQFYSNLATKNRLTKAQALRQAQLSLLDNKKDRRAAHPYYWAPFILIGNGL